MRLVVSVAGGFFLSMVLLVAFGKMDNMMARIADIPTLRGSGKRKIATVIDSEPYQVIVDHDRVVGQGLAILIENEEGEILEVGTSGAFEEGRETANEDLNSSNQEAQVRNRPSFQLTKSKLLHAFGK